MQCGSELSKPKDMCIMRLLHVDVRPPVIISTV